MYEEIREQAASAMRELLETANVPRGGLVVVGCSSSEIMGARIGKGSTPEAAEAVLEGIMPLLQERGLYLAAQCCEHLNRALIVEREAAEKFGYDPVCVIPQPKAGGSFATAAWRHMADPVAVEHVRAHAGRHRGDERRGGKVSGTRRTRDDGEIPLIFHGDLTLFSEPERKVREPDA